MSQPSAAPATRLLSGYGTLFDPACIGTFRDRGNSKNIMMDYCEADLVAENTIAVLVLADGMGGYAGGDKASELIVLKVLETFHTEPLHDIPAVMQRAFQLAEKEVFDARASNPELQRMGSTLVLVVVGNGKVRCAHLGDSRALLFRGDCVFRLTKDHLAVVEREGISDAGAKSHPVYGKTANVLSRYIGAAGVQPDYYEMDTVSGDQFVLVSDGVTEYVLEDRMWDLLHDNSPAQAAERIVREAVANKSHDHCSCVVLRVP